MSFIFCKVLNLTILFLLLFQKFMCKDIGALSTLQIEPLLTLFYIMVVTKKTGTMKILVHSCLTSLQKINGSDHC